MGADLKGKGLTRGLNAPVLEGSRCLWPRQPGALAAVLFGVTQMWARGARLLYHVPYTVSSRVAPSAAATNGEVAVCKLRSFGA